jgi:hypothetical protein
VAPTQQAAEPEFRALVKRPSMTPTADYEVERGGPQDYIAPDSGTDPKGAAPASVTLETAKPAAAERGVQGPDQ